jgi:hypothetical protein
MYLLFAVVFWLAGIGAALAQPMSEKILPMDGHITDDGEAIELNWFDANPPRVGSVAVKRRIYGQIGAESWKTRATGLGPVMRYRDDTIVPGVAYEYQVLRSARVIVDVGYWLAGTKLPATDHRGTAYVIVDETVADDIVPRLARFERDLTGDGWQVQRHLVPRGNRNGAKRLDTLKDALQIRLWLRARYEQDPFGQHVVILVGHVPMVLSGRANPDGHESHPHPSDLFYADMDGQWRVTPEGFLLENRVPSDFIEMQIGRIDFSNVSDGSHAREIHLLRAYFDKNFHWRRGLLGDLRNAYGNTGHLEVERAALRNVVGPNNLVIGGHHDVGEERPWLWGVDFGDWNPGRYAQAYTNKAVFSLNFGSGKQRIDGYPNAMTALLAQPWYPLAVGWGGRPAWWLHHMALGGSIGDAHLRTVNNGSGSAPFRETMDYFPTGKYLWRNPVWVNLLGDPTLRAFPLAPARGLQAQTTADGVSLSWLPSPDPDVLGYRLWRRSSDGAAFTRLGGDELITGSAFTDTDAPPDAIYMVRAYGLKTVYAGSFYTYSQGEFTQLHPDAEPYAPFEILLETPVSESLRMPEMFNTAAEGKIHAFVEAPSMGQLRHNGDGWIYTPPVGRTGDATVRVTVSDRGQTRLGLLRVRMTQ